MGDYNFLTEEEALAAAKRLWGPDAEVKRTLGGAEGLLPGWYVRAQRRGSWIFTTWDYASKTCPTLEQALVRAELDAKWIRAQDKERARRANAIRSGPPFVVSGSQQGEGE